MPADQRSALEQYFFVSTSGATNTGEPAQRALTTSITSGQQVKLSRCTAYIQLLYKDARVLGGDWNGGGGGDAEDVSRQEGPDSGACKSITCRQSNQLSTAFPI